MKEISFLERLAETVLEGGFASAFKARLEPVQIAKSLVREMERSRVVGPDSPLVPNSYTASLHPDDLAAYSQFLDGLERELATYLRSYAATRGYRVPGSLSVRLKASESTGRRHRVKVSSQMVDAPAPEPRSSDRGSEATAEMPRIDAPHGETSPPAKACLVDEDGGTVELGGEVTRIGRAIENDVVVEAAGVSRHHAQIIWEQDQYYLVDLESTNGTFAAGRRIGRHALADGEEIMIAGQAYTFRLLAEENVGEPASGH